MTYNHIPRPDIEDHYHIRDLIERQEKRTEDRVYHQERIKSLEEREKLISTSPKFTVLPFWCDKCNKEIVAQAILEIEEDWSNPTQQVAHYKTKCFKGHWLKRLLTDKWFDTYFFRSRVVAEDRAKHFSDILQPFESNYNLVYTKK